MADDGERVQTVRHLWQALAEHRDPSALFAPDARIVGSVFGSGFVHDAPATVEERWAEVQASDRSYLLRLIDATPIDGDRVVAVGAAGWGRTVQLVSVLYTFDGPLVASSAVFHSREGAFLAAGVPAPSPPAAT